MSRIIDDPILWDTLSNCDELIEFYEYDVDNEAFKKALNKIEKLKINVKPRSKITEETLEQLDLLLNHMQQLKELRIYNRFNERMDISSIFENITADIEVLDLIGCDLPEGISYEIANKFEKMKRFLIEKSNIPKIPTFPQNGCRIILGRGLTEISDVKCIDYGTDKESRNVLQVAGNDEVATMLDVLDESPLPLYLYRKYKEFIPRYGNICISISNVSDLTVEQLEKLQEDEHVKNIVIEGGCYHIDDKNNWYSLEEYKAVRTEIDKIIAQIKLPDQNDPDRDKKIFAQVYKLLGKRISYDHYAVDDKDGKVDNQLQYNCRKLKNGLVGVERNGKNECLAVCAGYADILRNVLACFNIKGHYVSSHSEVEWEYKNGAYDEKKDENGKRIYRNGTTDPKGHAYNLVELDGQKFYCDLTWDANNIKVDRLPLWNFLNSYEHFIKSHTDVGFDEMRADKEANFTMPFEEQRKLFGEIAKEEVMQMAEENYLSGFVSSYLESMKQSGKDIESKKFLEMIEFIKRVEEAVFARGEKNKSNVGVNIGEDMFVLETSDNSKLSDMKKEINRRRRRECGHESR